MPISPKDCASRFPRLLPFVRACGRKNPGTAAGSSTSIRKNSANTFHSSAGKTCAGSYSVSRCGWCVRWGSKRFVDRPAPLNSRRAASTRKQRARTQDASIRQLLDDLANEERNHEERADALEKEKLTAGVKAQEDEANRRLFVLQIVQPGLAGLMDGSVSTLAPVFAAALATRNSWDAFVVGLAASIGAGISMGFAEALSDDGSLTGRGHPWIRGLVCGAMTALGGVGHTLPFLIKDFRYAMALAIAVVLVELGVITWIRHRYMDTPIPSAALQVGLGGALVFVTGILIGSS